MAMHSERLPNSNRVNADGYLLVEAIVGVVLLGVGAMTAGTLSIWITDPDPALDVDMQNRIDD